MKPKLTINATTYGILCFAGAGSLVLPSDLTMPTAMADSARVASDVTCAATDAASWIVEPTTLQQDDR